MLNPVVAVTRGWGHVVGAVRDYAALLPEGGVFTTTELLVLKLKRQSLDTALSRMVKKGELERLALGVFRMFVADLPYPSLEEIANAKMNARSKLYFALAESLDHALAIDIEKPLQAIETAEGPELRLVTDGPTSSFKTVVGVVVMKHVAPRKLHMEKEGEAVKVPSSKVNVLRRTELKRSSILSRRVGLVLRTIWAIGKDNIKWSDANLALVKSNFARVEKKLVRDSVVWMPQWMYETLCFDDKGRPLLN